MIPTATKWRCGHIGSGDERWLTFGPLATRGGASCHSLWDGAQHSRAYAAAPSPKRDRGAMLRRHTRRLEALGYRVTVEPRATTAS